MTQDIVQSLEDSIQNAKQFVEMDKALERLEANRDFKMLITDGYLSKEAVRLVHLKGDPAMQTPDKQAAVVRQIDAISNLLQYFRTVSFLAANAVKSIEADEATRDEILAEELQRG